MRDFSSFNLEIDGGNDACRTNEDVAGILRSIADKVEAGDDFGTPRDLNGNTVGDWGFRPEAKTLTITRVRRGEDA